MIMRTWRSLTPVSFERSPMGSSAAHAGADAAINATTMLASFAFMIASRSLRSSGTSATGCRNGAFRTEYFRKRAMRLHRPYDGITFDRHGKVADRQGNHRTLIRQDQSMNMECVVALALLLQRKVAQGPLHQSGCMTLV